MEYHSDLVTDDNPERTDETAIVGATPDPTAHPFEAAGGADSDADGEADSADSADDSAEIDLELLDSIEQELADVELALERLGDGTYGRCETCGQILGEDELEHAPAGRYCRAHLPLVLP